MAVMQTPSLSLKVPAFTAVILAGGLSSRMGQDKALLQINGQSLLEHMQQRVSQAGASQIIISRNQPGFIADITPEQGPLGGILSVLPHCTEPKLLIVPIDIPLVSAASLQQLLTASSAACYFTEHPLPCVLPNNAALKKRIISQLHTGQRSIKALLHGLNASQLSADNTQLINTNTPAQWQHCMQQLTLGVQDGQA